MALNGIGTRRGIRVRVTAVRMGRLIQLRCHIASIRSSARLEIRIANWTGIRGMIDICGCSWSTCIRSICQTGRVRCVMRIDIRRTTGWKERFTIGINRWSLGRKDIPNEWCILTVILPVRRGWRQEKHFVSSSLTGKWATWTATGP